MYDLTMAGLQMGTKAKWWMVPTIWGPVALWMQARAVSKGLPHHLVLPVFLAGLLAWTLTEYLLHRFLFHMKTSSYWQAPNQHLYLSIPCRNSYRQNVLSKATK